MKAAYYDGNSSARIMYKFSSIILALRWNIFPFLHKISLYLQASMREKQKLYSDTLEILLLLRFLATSTIVKLFIASWYIYMWQRSSERVLIKFDVF